MPELPEVETMRKGLLPLQNAVIAGVTAPDCACKPISIRPGLAQIAKRVANCSIESLGRAGKRLLIQMEGGDVLAIEPRMTGLVVLAAPPDAEHVRFALTTCAGQSMLFWDRRGLGTIQLFTAAEWKSFLDSGKLGPDALLVDAEHLSCELATSKRAIKVALLDQAVVAGIGNIYASEILHLAGVHPARPCHSITREQWRKIVESTRSVLELAIQFEGSTLADGAFRNTLNQFGGYQNHHRVYDRAGESCGNCKNASVVRIVQGQRSTYYCPGCQPLRRARRRSVSPGGNS